MSVRVFIGEDKGFETLMSKRLVGPTFNWREFHLAIWIESGSSFPAVRYFVVDVLSATVIAIGEKKSEAIEMARAVIHKVPRPQFLELLLAQEQAAAEWRRQEEARYKAAKAEADALIEAASQRPIPRKRAAVFERHSGKCFYCGIELEMRGKWHIEHRIPRSKGGTDLPENLVPACVPCNQAKGTKTDEEFKALK